MNENKKWFAVYTRPRWEKKVSEILTRRKIENYCPLNKVARKWSDRKKIVHEPLFTSYVFVRISESELLSIKQTYGVINLVYWLGKPALIRDSEIGMIRKFLNDHLNVRIEKTPISINERIQVVNGPLMELEGKVIALKSRAIKIVLPSLGYMIHAEENMDNVKAVTPRLRILEQQELPNNKIAVNE